MIWNKSNQDLDIYGGGVSCNSKGSSSSRLLDTFLIILGLTPGAAPSAEVDGVGISAPYAVRTYAPGERIFCHRIGGGSGKNGGLQLSLVVEGVATVKVRV
jgi:hypothetical protein